MNMPSLWPGGWWRVRDIVEQQKIAAWATVDLAARNRETVLWNMYLKGTRQTERGAKRRGQGVRDCRRQHDPLTVRKLVNMLLESGVEVQQAKAQVIADGRVYGAGSFIVPMAQPKQGLVRWMLGRTFYPDNSYTRDRDGSPIRPVRHVHRHVRRVHGRAQRSDWRGGHRRSRQADRAAAAGRNRRRERRRTDTC